MDLYGVTPSVGRLYGIMYFQHEPMTLDEMKDELGMSKPSMSTAVKKLQDNEMVQKSWKKGSRRDMFIAQKDFFKSFSQFFCKKWEKEVIVNLEASIKAEEMLEKIINNDDIDEGIREEAKVYYEQINESKYYYKWLKRLVDSFKSGDIYKCIPKNDE
jgi:DNA-binding transcriptional regulator GbsR (MarR family)